MRHLFCPLVAIHLLSKSPHPHIHNVRIVLCNTPTPHKPGPLTLSPLTYQQTPQKWIQPPAPARFLSVPVSPSYPALTSKRQHSSSPPLLSFQFISYHFPLNPMLLAASMGPSIPSSRSSFPLLLCSSTAYLSATVVPPQLYPSRQNGRLPGS